MAGAVKTSSAPPPQADLLFYARAGVREQTRRGWELNIEDARYKIHRLSEESPGLRGKLPDIYADAYHFLPEAKHSE